MTTPNDPDVTIDLPPIHTFQRPFWAYDKLPDGWNVLRRLLFGNTQPVIEELAAYGDTRLTNTELNRLLSPNPIHPGVHCILMHANRGKTAAELSAWYQQWENQHFTEYCRRVKSQEMAKLGLKLSSRLESYEKSK